MKTYFYILLCSFFVCFWHEANGNNTFEGTRTRVAYNAINLPQQVQLLGGRGIKNVYAADGRKLKSEAKQGSEYIKEGTKTYCGNKQSTGFIQRNGILITIKKIKMKTIGVILSILLVAMMACKDNAVIKQEENGIAKIIIQVHPSFHKKSMFLWDVEQGEVIFNHIGPKKGIRFSLYPNVSGEVLAPKSIGFKLDTVSTNFLRAIKFEDKDFIDDEENGEFDGASISMLFIFKDMTFKDIDFRLGRDKKSVIIKFLIDATIPHQQDSASRVYLKELREYGKL